MRNQADHRYNILCTVFFVLMILVPLAARITGMYRPQEVSERENRQLAKRPRVDLTLLDPFPMEYEIWYNDHFFLRERMIDLQTWWKLNIPKESPFPDKVTIGKAGWLFDAGKERAFYEGKVTIPEEGFRYIAEELHLRTLWYRERGIRFYVLIAPLKHEIYREFLPGFYHRAPGGTLTDRLTATILEDTVIRLILPKAALIKDKENRQVYMKLDNHWNYVGGYIAYRELMKEISKDFPSLHIIGPGDFQYEGIRVTGGNLSDMIGMTGHVSDSAWFPRFTPLRSFQDTVKRYKVPDIFPYPSEYEVRRYIPGSNLPKLMMIRDSYGQFLFPYLSETFGTSFMLFDGWNYHLNPEFVEKEKPDVVVLEIFEPFIKSMFNSLDCLMAEKKKRKGN